MPTLGVVMKQVKGVVHRYLHIAELSEIDENPSIIVPDQVPRPEIAMLELTTHGGHIRQRSVDRVDDGGIDAGTTQQFQARLYLRAQVDERRAREKTGQGKGRSIQHGGGDLENLQRAAHPRLLRLAMHELVVCLPR